MTSETDLNQSRCLVTGGAGFIGSHLVRALLAAGAHVTAFDNLSTGSWDHLPGDTRLTRCEGDVRIGSGLRALVEESDFVFHLAAQVGNVKSIRWAVEDAESNILGTVRVLEACRGSNVRAVVYSSSSAIFGEATRLPIDEDHPTAPASFYALSKFTGERYARLAVELWGVPAVCLRYFNVFGLPMENNEYTGVISIFFEALRTGNPLKIYGDGGQIRDFVYAKDVAAANLLAATRGLPGDVFNVGSGVPTSISSLATLMADIAGGGARIEYFPSRPGEVRDSCADITRARQALGFQPAYDLRRGLEDMWASLESRRRADDEAPRV